MYTRLNLTTNKKEAHADAIELDTRRDIAYYDTLCLYCAENNIDLSDISDDDFMQTSEAIEEYSKASRKAYDRIYFWIDKK